MRFSQRFVRQSDSDDQQIADDDDRREDDADDADEENDRTVASELPKTGNQGLRHASWVNPTLGEIKIKLIRAVRLICKFEKKFILLNLYINYITSLPSEIYCVQVTNKDELYISG